MRGCMAGSCVLMAASALACGGPAPPSTAAPPQPSSPPMEASPPGGSPTGPTTTAATPPPPPHAPTPPGAPVERRGEGVDLVHVLCTRDTRSRPERSFCTEAPADAPRTRGLDQCDLLTRRAATPSTLTALTEVWKAARNQLPGGGRVLELSAMVPTPRDMPRPQSVGGRPALMIVQMRVLGMRHSKTRAAGCENPPPNTGCDPVAVGHGPLVPAEAHGEVQMVSQGFLGVGRCTGPL